MAELVAVPGDPVNLVTDFSARARKFELSSAALILADLAVNLTLILLVLQYLIR